MILREICFKKCVSPSNACIILWKQNISLFIAIREASRVTDAHTLRKMWKDLYRKYRFRTGHRIFSLARRFYSESEARVIFSLLIGLYAIELGGLYHRCAPNSETISLIHADKLLLVWALVTHTVSELKYLVTFISSCLISIPSSSAIWFFIIYFSRNSKIELRFFSIFVWILSTDDDDDDDGDGASGVSVPLKSILKVAQLVGQGVNPCLPNSKHPVRLPKGVMSSVCKYLSKSKVNHMGLVSGLKGVIIRGILALDVTFTGFWFSECVFGFRSDFPKCEKSLFKVCENKFHTFIWLLTKVCTQCHTRHNGTRQHLGNFFYFVFETNCFLCVGFVFYSCIEESGRKILCSFFSSLFFFSGCGQLPLIDVLAY